MTALLLCADFFLNQKTQINDEQNPYRYLYRAHCGF